MARVHFVKSARKDYPDHKIKKGESYYWWQFAFRGKSFSKTQPTRSQLTQSGFLQAFYDLQDRIGSLSAETADDLQTQVEDIISEIESVRDEQQERLDNMPEHLQESSGSGQLLQERIEGLEQWQSDIENIDLNYEADEDLKPDEQEEALREFIEQAIMEIQALDPGF